jgi:hypothetical protein
MEIDQLRKNFDEQITATEKQIDELESNLVKAKEYRTKLQGGLETLNLLENKEEEEKSPQAELTE